MRAEIYWIKGDPQHRLALMPRPRGGDWLETEMQSFRSVGVDVLVSLLTDDEIAELNLLEEANCCQASGMEFVRFPIPDRTVPTDEAAFAQLVETLHEHLSAGRGVAIHCRQGIGRSALLAARVLCAGHRIRADRRCPRMERARYGRAAGVGDPHRLPPHLSPRLPVNRRCATGCR